MVRRAFAELLVILALSPFTAPFQTCEILGTPHDALSTHVAAPATTLDDCDTVAPVPFAAARHVQAIAISNVSSNRFSALPALIALSAGFNTPGSPHSAARQTVLRV